jgi:hypothetical protein
VPAGACPFTAPLRREKTAREIWPTAQDQAEVRRMLFIAVGLVVALVAMDFLDLSKLHRS